MKLNVPIVIIGVIVAFGLLAFGRFTSSDTQQVYRLLSEADESESEMAALRSSIRLQVFQLLRATVGSSTNTQQSEAILSAVGRIAGLSGMLEDKDA